VKIQTIEEGVKRLFAERREIAPEFSFRSRRTCEYSDVLIFNGEELPVPDYIYDNRIRYTSDYAGKNVGEICALNGYSFVGRDVPMNDLLYRELGIAEFILHSRIEKIMAFATEFSVNMIATMENGTCANMDYGNSMAEGALNQCQHRVITKHGMANDCAVAHLTVARQVAVHGCNSTEPTYFDDDEYYLYGLSENQIRKVFAIYNMLKGNEDGKAWVESDLRLRAAVEAVFESDKLGEAILIKDVLSGRGCEK